MTILTGDITVETKGNNDVVDLTRVATTWVEKSGASEGTLTLFSPHTTTGVTALEFEPGANRDLGDILERLIPRDADYHHNVADTNGHAHARAAIVGPSVSVPILQGKLALGTWQSLALIDFDVRPRTRRVIVQVHG